MSLLNSKFDIVSVDNPLALAALAQVLESPAGMTLGINGTPVAGTIPAGAIVTIDSNGKAALASTNVDARVIANRQLVFVAIDGDQDYSGSFVKKLTDLHGGYTMETDQLTPGLGRYAKGAPVTFSAGKVKPHEANEQIFGFVGPAGADSVKGIVQIIVPQGCGI
jgi:hypothetical protein